ncbi:hypothetical protein [Streptomyces sp. NPDC058620]|uniref:hypothetical protein n=1 Tax=Streptomyces sp. NPDC058620 TaxID=3346560 RepID=UPI00365D0755
MLALFFRRSPTDGPYRLAGLADAVGVALADRYGTNRIFTLGQRGFRAITP